ncbi:MAG TPA: cytochrome d ubiquinol oxidase subunit II [Bryobacteraceae bacterium]|jgi:cytochrome d ubiquinol oxidase subunit II|nr:cytochrome d ubiquinol oxidase subunit II [Bryobacteraceae bacterium]
MGAVWFWLVAAMLSAYIVLDGFDIGVGILQPFIGRNSEERGALLETIEPVWDGNEVWLIAAGGTILFAFPVLYAIAFSGFYLPVTTIVWLIVFRGIGIELRRHIQFRLWREFFDACFVLASLLLALFFGIGLANVVRGVGMNPDGPFFLPLWTNLRPGPMPGLLDWFTLPGGLLAIASLGLHGALYLTFKTQAELQLRARRWVFPLLGAVVILTAFSIPAIAVVRPASLENYRRFPVAFVVPALVVAALAGILIFSLRGQWRRAFANSCLFLVAMVLGAAASLYPTVLPSSVDPALDLTIQKAEAGPHALSAGLLWWAFGIALAMGYFLVVYGTLRGRAGLNHASSREY